MLSSVYFSKKLGVKTVTLRRLQQILKDESRISVAKSLSVEKHGIMLATLITALYDDRAQDKQMQIPKQGERRERELQELITDVESTQMTTSYCLQRADLIGYHRILTVWRDTQSAPSVRRVQVHLQLMLVWAPRQLQLFLVENRVKCWSARFQMQVAAASVLCGAIDRS